MRDLQTNSINPESKTNNRTETEKGKQIQGDLTKE